MVAAAGALAPAGAPASGAMAPWALGAQGDPRYTVFHLLATQIFLNMLHDFPNVHKQIWIKFPGEL
jgi:hypothetical protein